MVKINSNYKQPAQILVTSLIIITIVTLAIVAITTTVQRSASRTSLNLAYESNYNQANDVLVSNIDVFADQSLTRVEDFQDQLSNSPGFDYCEQDANSSLGTAGIVCAFSNDAELRNREEQAEQRTIVRIYNSKEVRNYSLSSQEHFDVLLPSQRSGDQLEIRWIGESAFDYRFIYPATESDLDTMQVLVDPEDVGGFGGNSESTTSGIVAQLSKEGTRNTIRLNLNNVPEAAEILRISPIAKNRSVAIDIRPVSSTNLPDQVRVVEASSYNSGLSVSSSPVVSTQIPLSPAVPSPLYNAATLRGYKVPMCGNGIVEAAEQCDLGINNGADGSRCAGNCEFARLCTDDDIYLAFEEGEETCDVVAIYGYGGRELYTAEYRRWLSEEGITNVNVTGLYEQDFADYLADLDRDQDIVIFPKFMNVLGYDNPQSAYYNPAYSRAIEEAKKLITIPDEHLVVLHDHGPFSNGAKYEFGEYGLNIAEGGLNLHGYTSKFDFEYVNPGSRKFSTTVPNFGHLEFATETKETRDSISGLDLVFNTSSAIYDIKNSRPNRDLDVSGFYCQYDYDPETSPWRFQANYKNGLFNKIGSTEYYLTSTQITKSDFVGGKVQSVSIKKTRGFNQFPEERYVITASVNRDTDNPVCTKDYPDLNVSVFQDFISHCNTRDEWDLQKNESAYVLNTGENKDLIEYIVVERDNPLSNLDSDFVNYLKGVFPNTTFEAMEPEAECYWAEMCVAENSITQFIGNGGTLTPNGEVEDRSPLIDQARKDTFLKLIDGLCGT